MSPLSPVHTGGTWDSAMLGWVAAMLPSAPILGDAGAVLVLVLVVARASSLLIIHRSVATSTVSQLHLNHGNI